MHNIRRTRTFVLLLLTICVCSISQAHKQWDCGERKVKTEFLIVGGAEVKEGYFPWHAAIYHLKGNKFRYKCGGSIIASNLILTSAHCIVSRNGVMPTSQISVEVGRTELNRTNNIVQVYNVTTLIPHPNFHVDSVADDIALIQLGTDISMTNFVQPICLWSDDSRLESIVGRNGSVVGFGQTMFETVSNYLREALIEVADSITCIESDPQVYGLNLNSKMFCGRGSNGVSACSGDSGGGLVFEDEGRWFIRGLVSFIPKRGLLGSCDITKYTVFTDVAKYRTWMAQYVHASIMSVTNEFPHDTSPKLKLFNLDTCGVAWNETNNFFIPYPWVGWLQSQNSDKMFICLVTLINQWYAVGAAHCFNDNNARYSVLLGLENKSKVNRCFVQNSHPCAYRHSIEAVFKHPKINLDHFTNDIALIELGEPSNVTPICLSVTTELQATSNKPTYSHISVEHDISYVNVTYCQNQYNSRGYQLVLDQRKFCASLADNLYYDGASIQEIHTFGGSERFVLRGNQILSMEVEDKILAVFNNIDYYLSWILYKMKNKTLANDDSSSALQTGNATMNTLDINSCGVVQDTKYAFPWVGVIALYNNRRYERMNHGHATLISRWYAISHVLSDYENTDNLYVILGDVEQIYNIKCVERLNQKLCNPPIQTLPIKRAINHPEYDRSKLYNDISIIVLLEPADITQPHVRPICLPFAPEYRNSRQDHFTLTTYVFSKLIPQNMTYVPPEVCKSQILPAMYYEYQKHTELCATCGNGFEQCGSLYFKGHLYAYTQRQPDKQFLMGLEYRNGILSDKSTMFEKVGKHVDWMLHTIKNITKNKPETRKETIEKDLKMAQHDAYSSFKLSLLDFYNCGIRNGTNGTLADSDTFPWIGLLFKKGMNSSICHVTLIGVWYAVAPAICFEDTNDDKYTIQFGQLRTPRDAASVDEIYHRVKEVIIIAGTNDKSAHDVALILLEKPANTTDPNVISICLPVLRSYFVVLPIEMMVATYQTGRNTGTSFNSNHVSSIACVNQWGTLIPTLRRNYDGDDIFDTICAVRNLSNHTDACTDVALGAPLQALYNIGGVEQYVLQGVFAHQESNCSLRKLDVYIDVYVFRESIVNNMTFNYDLREMLVFKN